MADLGLNTYRGKVPTTDVYFNKHWKETKIKYRVLSISQLSKAWIQTIKAVLKTLVTGTAAETYCRTTANELALQGVKSDWAYIVADHDHLGNIGIMTYRGIQVALFFKRQTTEIAPVVGEKPPDSPLTDPDDIWQRLDILGPSAKKANIVLKNYHDQLEADNDLLTKQLKLERQKHSNTEDKLFKYQEAENTKKAALAKRAQAERDKLKPKRKKLKTDRLCMICHCYENVHNFKGQKCLGCDGGKPKCSDCTFRPKKIRLKKELTAVKKKKK